jgi:hypothetical protein
MAGCRWVCHAERSLTRSSSSKLLSGFELKFRIWGHKEAVTTFLFLFVCVKLAAVFHSEWWLPLSNISGSNPGKGKNSFLQAVEPNTRHLPEELREN